jgi:hypothetical protein
VTGCRLRVGEGLNIQFRLRGGVGGTIATYMNLGQNGIVSLSIKLAVFFGQRRRSCETT